MFLLANEFLYMVKMYRVCSVRGRFGSGKTLLGCAIGAEFWRRGHAEHMYSNLHLKGDWDEGLPAPGKLRDAVVVYDEAWQTLDSRSFGAKRSQQWMAYLRKRKITLLLPSVFNIDVRFRVLVVQRVVEINRWAWLYQWKVDDGFRPFGGMFLLLEPLKYGEIYDHMEEPDEERGERLAEGLSGWQLTGKGKGEDRELLLDPEAEKVTMSWRPDGKRS